MVLAVIERGSILASSRPFHEALEAAGRYAPALSTMTNGGTRSLAISNESLQIKRMKDLSATTSIMK